MKPRFLNLLHKADIGWPQIMLLTDLLFKDRDGRVWRVPKGFVCDQASVPFGLRWLVPKAGKFNRAVVLHDWLFYLHLTGQLDMTRSEVDSLMHQAMIADGVRFTQRWLIRAGLFAGSWIPWYFGSEQEQALPK